MAQERDLDTFLEGFAAKKADRLRELREKQNAVVGALERLARSEAAEAGKSAAAEAQVTQLAHFVCVLGLRKIILGNLMHISTRMGALA